MRIDDENCLEWEVIELLGRRQERDIVGQLGLESCEKLQLFGAFGIFVCQGMKCDLFWVHSDRVLKIYIYVALFSLHLPR